MSKYKIGQQFRIKPATARAQYFSRRTKAISAEMPPVTDAQPTIPTN